VGLTVSYGFGVAFPGFPLVGDTVAFTSNSELGPTVPVGGDVDIPLPDELRVGAIVPDGFPVALSPSEDVKVGAKVKSGDSVPFPRSEETTVGSKVSSGVAVSLSDAWIICFVDRNSQTW